jgi:DnaJ-class molecular chaperone with C-terminal Zn finger domain
MPNRFVRKIKSGEIESVEELKSEFKSLAKESHPDIAGAESGADFVALRDEYEAALRDFQKHRFGARSAGSGAPRSASDTESHNASIAMSEEAWPCLALLFKRGFPKIPRHEKERLRYEYARWRFRQALGSALASRFDDCELELLASKASGDPALEPEIGLLRSLLDYRELGLAPMRTEIVMTMGRLLADPRVGAGFRGFARGLAAEIGIGHEID